MSEANDVDVLVKCSPLEQIEEMLNEAILQRDFWALVVRKESHGGLDMTAAKAKEWKAYWDGQYFFGAKCLEIMKRD